MIITIKQAEPSILQLTFTANELKNSLFTATLNKMYNSTDYDVHKSGDDVDVTNIVQNTFEVVGQAVDSIRELWCGDVVFSYDAEGKPLPKDLSKCPCFKIGDYDAPVEPTHIP